ncbi:hypothetical protein CLAFUW4_09169 [Fulvia fulva]|uniref:Uncharacterized protein n=1 Tax=Passalora fulva TaxID=5499 RepID=A0A9Q8UT71_PASFU|nr:uncharacterized protein CLAFUR5_09269 [Fulvia fulva]KAK4613756.1 hypothetical protein CLAFUR4_09175 [Fulvia fulva]KAK4614798.1 hypothetical protein CLAFUR0_09167 [Fulvia fulva]UJO21507.1 hypothetical protein CLAFUR5_09269 [Fulvia fulva]WPV19882.1 hypothetical protein CLAFUW4_09169 [Fulvia fulva]WPV34738.1 hypothetical protein CLAFUW7_09170 [Fulvia fulva]
MSATKTEPGANKVDTGLTDSTHGSASSSASAERYRLDEFDETPILLYKYRGGLQTSSQKDLCSWLDKDEKLRVTKKQIPRMSSYVEIKRHDLYLPDEQEMYKTLPNYDSSLASIKLPSTAYWSRLFLGNYDNLYIVSPETTPTSSVADEDSQRTSPTSTWGQGSEELARMGATEEHRNI